MEALLLFGKDALPGSGELIPLGWGLLASLDTCRDQGALEPRQENFSHLLPPLLNSHHHAEQDHHQLLYEPGLEGDFPLTPHPSENAGAQRGSE